MNSKPIPLPFGSRFVYNKNQHIGNGSYGYVCRGILIESGQQVAVKWSTRTEESKNEITALKLFTDNNARNIVKILGAKTEDNDKVVIFALEQALFSLEDLMRFIENISGLNQNIMIDLISDCCSATESFCEYNYAHRDLKPGNILVFRGPKPSSSNQRRSEYLFKFCDVGGAKQHDGVSMVTLVGTPAFLHPKLAEANANPNHKWKVNEHYTGLQCDLFALGCTIFKAASGQMPFPQESNADYYQAVKKLLLKEYETAISAEKSNDIKEPYSYKSTLPGSSCSKWFEHCVASLIRMMLHNPDIKCFREVADALRDSKEFTFFSLVNLSIVKYCDLSDHEVFQHNYPSLLPLIVEEGFKGNIGLLGGLNSNVEFWSPTDMDLSKISTDDTYVVHPIASQIVLPSKSWLTAPLEENFIPNEPKFALINRRSQCVRIGVQALHDCGSLIDMTEATVNILKKFTVELQKVVHSVLKEAEINARLNIYGGSQCQALALLTSGDNRKLGMQGNTNAEHHEHELSSYIGELNDADEHLSRLIPQYETLQLNERHLVDVAGIEEELSWYINDSESIKQSKKRVRDLVQKCVERRLNLADQMRTRVNGSNDDPIVHRLLKLISTLLVWYRKVRDIQKKVVECSVVIEAPLQEIKSRVETLMAEQNVNPKDLRRLRVNLSNYARLSDSSREIRDLVSRLGNLMTTSQ